MKNYFEKLKERWGVDHFWQVGLILFIFSITGMTALYVRKYAFYLLGFNESTPFWEEAITWVLVVFPSYQVLFLVYGFLLGQFDFVWRFEKKSLLKLKKLFVRIF
ncbi:MAG: prolipoprotein diacylglyceryl transferase [Gracilimonas sp.]|uniref:DUF6787 family protein n=1 Tax=Gracilimonas sp. TaxID=1974203 RepID=UPI00374FDE94|nr:prolipoprotein diacylglyceryl transferase [Gracilimonas sp.]